VRRAGRFLGRHHESRAHPALDPLPISGHLRLGGRYQLKGNSGGEITACDPPDGSTLVNRRCAESGHITVQGSLDENDQVIERLATNRPDDAFHVRSLQLISQKIASIHTMRAESHSETRGYVWHGPLLQ
jgi:hypothetical protein